MLKIRTDVISHDHLANSWYVFSGGRHRRFHTNDTTSWPLEITPEDLAALYKVHPSAEYEMASPVHANGVSEEPAFYIRVSADEVVAGGRRNKFVLWSKDEQHT